MTLIAVVDDKVMDREEALIVVRDAGFEPIAVVPRDVDVSEFFDDVCATGAEAVLLDHRLSQITVKFTGAELGAYCYRRHMPPILRTTFGSSRDDMNLRRYRRWLPRVLSRAAGGDEVAEAVSYSHGELEGGFERMRRPQRSLLEIVDGDTDGHEPVVDIIVPPWREGEAIRVPFNLFPGFASARDPRDWVGRRFFGQVNVWAEAAEDVYVEDVEPAEEPPADFLATRRDRLT